MAHRFAFVTIGQTPRDDLVPEMLPFLGKDVTVDQFGVLDGLSEEIIARAGPASGQHRLVTRLRDGSQVVLEKSWVQGRLQQILDGMEAPRYTAVLLLCTGRFPGLEAPGLFLDAQHLVDFGTAALCSGAQRVGVLLPLPEQIREFHLPSGPDRELVFSHASPYQGDRFREAARELAGADLIVMHCMGYTETQRQVVAEISGRPVLLARRLVATSLANLS